MRRSFFVFHGLTLKMLFKMRQALCFDIAVQNAASPMFIVGTTIAPLSWLAQGLQNRQG
jgi:hypothetical protein